MNQNSRRTRPVCLPLQATQLRRLSTLGKLRDQYIPTPADSFANSNQDRLLAEHGQSIASTKEASIEPSSGDTDVDTKHKGEVIATLKRAPGKIHISFDGLTSRTRQPLYGIACFFRNYEFGLNDKIGYFALDNASNNDTAMDYIGETLGFDGRKRRGRCLGHVLNISARALLFGNHADALEDDPTGAHIISDTEWERWQSKGPVGYEQLLTILEDQKQQAEDFPDPGQYIMRIVERPQSLHAVPWREVQGLKTMEDQLLPSTVSTVQSTGPAKRRQTNRNAARATRKTEEITDMKATIELLRDENTIAAAEISDLMLPIQGPQFECR
ncbi:reverse transcriptase [Apiospora marii]|uniref:Reverse transcriptase n=1 Tax=Apiospora marii TaxID=335849 RepID=A0ABR1RK00_9PEZI